MGIFHLTINQAQTHTHTITQPKMTNVQETFKNTNLIKQDGSEVSGAVLKDKKVLVYFSAHWCPPCRGFTPVLKEKWENQLKSADVQIVFVSSDRDDASATSYFNNDHGDYFMAPHGCEAGMTLKSDLGVRGIPTLAFFNADGSLNTKDGRSIVASDDLSKILN